MGEVAETTTFTKKTKKKGRPSLIDIQKRALKQQQQQLLNQELRSNSKNPNSGTGSNRRSANSDEDDERRDKKHRLLHGLDSNFKSERADLDDDASVSRRKIGSDDTGAKATHILQRSLVESGPFTPLPDKKLLLFILDRVQKKDTYGVYSDPVDPEELPDYHEIIKNPMDFGTLRKKLDAGAYASLEQFERDVFLICTNAMEYNSADTVYHRQARGMLELAKKDFENLRQESDGEEEPVSQSQQPKVVKRGRPPGSGVKKHPEPSSIDRTTSEIAVDAAAAHIPSYGDSSRLSGAYNLRKTPPSYGYRQVETSVRINRYSDNQSSFSIDWEKEFPAKVVKAVNKYGMKNVDEHKRDSYYETSTSLQESSIFTVLEDDLKQLIPVGVKTEYGYARSLARYAANLGPVAWRYANKRIETLLPTGIKFGPGWVGENQEAPPQQQSLMSGKQMCSSDLACDGDHKSKEQETEKSERLINPESNGLVPGSNGLTHNQNQMLNKALSQQGLLPNIKKECNGYPPDLNAKLVSPNSPVSNHQVCSSQQPDLALQL